MDCQCQAVKDMATPSATCSSVLGRLSAVAWDELNGASNWLPRGCLRLSAVIHARVPNIGSGLNLTLIIVGRERQRRSKADAALARNWLRFERPAALPGQRPLLHAANYPFRPIAARHHQVNRPFVQLDNAFDSRRLPEMGCHLKRLSESHHYLHRPTDCWVT